MHLAQALAVQRSSFHGRWRSCRQGERAREKGEEIRSKDAGRHISHQLPAVQPVESEELERGLLLEHGEHERLHDLDRAERSSTARAGEGLSHQRGALRRHLPAEEDMPAARRAEPEEHDGRTLRGRGFPREAEGRRPADRPDLPHGEEERAGLLDPRVHR